MNTKVYIFDVDGTLYSLKKMHFFMLIKLVSYYFFHIYKLNELFVIWIFRKYRERDEFKNVSIENLEMFIASKYSMKLQSVEYVINKWLFEIPLKTIQLSAYNDVLEFIKKERNLGNTIVIYSDYPSEKKLAALEIQSDYSFCSEDINIQELKPSKKAMDYILATVNKPKDNFTYIGDRYIKDGKSAEFTGIDYIDIKKFRRILKGVD